MKFTPNIDKHEKRHDAATKIHVTFDDPEDDVRENKRSHPAHNHKTPQKKRKLDSSNPPQKKSASPIKSETNNKKTPQKKYDTKKKKLTQEEILAKVAAIRQKKKLKRKNRTTIDGQTVARAAFQLNTESLTEMIPTTQLREFILYALSETCNLPWFTLVNKAQVERLVLVYAPGLNYSYFGVPHDTPNPPPFVDLESLKKEEWIGKASMPFLAKQSRYMLLHMISGEKGQINSPVADLLQCKMSISKKEKVSDENQKKIQAFKDNMREFYVLTLKEMKDGGYPIPPSLDPTSVLPDGWKETRPPADGVLKNPKRIVAMDCEMVMTEKGSALARITLIDEDGSVLLDELVKPDDPITDYLTQYSGITPEALGSTTCSLRRAQKHVRKIVDHNVILVGHSLENDLKAIQLAHPYCVDTSSLYDHLRGPPYKPSLKHLARTYLHRQIQGHHASREGHDSAEDARATLDLFKLKLANKPRFGKFKKAELVFDRLSAHRPARSSAILESSRSATRLFGATLSGDYHRTETDEALVELTLEKIKEKNFLFTRYITADEASARREQEDGAAPTVLPSAADDTGRATRLQTLDSYIRRLYRDLPENSFLMVVGGTCDIPQYKT
ncbi:hypothetical protein G6F46_000899 [Rhizopus delemar]|uniref:Exonuclease domain-containing protein n=3 Tax=Rhizopus TaxID=4842 RepID=I1BVE2_RHIO9|nr:hypothetical protein RO3G_04877 [Rhizopus delemar RA 99-880]KAG1464285.1 hypothetical protein G6F55_001880 [Rhizopus delemar]KAG1549896.1 hypothetical protein G6F51_002780 [Rhizopus arrhizus]KAG1502002.1 hypothetical protein G6F54_002650 [Rhizopus delemar]KAG1520142.1 hypothetical protein G6F52_007944 [Rhizopus delemar]|eukprot:EIE80172.1 hypothetical protein RO3G_04877 [Rhizopus delemar RA 99-880]